MKSFADQRIPSATDVVVVGSGVAGLTAALRAAHSGSRVLLAERSRRIGGTSAYSGGMLWIPMNRHMKDKGIDDSLSDARQYVTAFGLGRVPSSLVESYLDAGPRMLDFIESVTPVRFSCHPSLCDYREEVPGWRRGGRALEPSTVPGGVLGAYAGEVRDSVHFGRLARFSREEMRRYSKMEVLDRHALQAIEELEADDVRARGRGLVTGLLAGCLESGVVVVTGARVVELQVLDGAVRGVVIESQHGRKKVKAARGVILACGGYEWDLRLRQLLPAAPLEGAPSPPFNDGDNLRLAAMAGSELSRLDSAWWAPLMQQEGELHDGQPLFRTTMTERALPGSICVNREGQRFTNEAVNYNDFGRAMFQVDPLNYLRHEANRSVWLVFDHGFKNRYSVGSVTPSTPAPDWMLRAKDLDELARLIGVPTEAFKSTVGRFNEMAREGVDEDFGRGHYTHDRVWGDPDYGSNPSLGTLAEPPFYATRLYRGALGTNGGPTIDAQAQVLNLDGQAIPGLFACGNACASVMVSYPGAGATLGSAATFGYLAGLAATQN